VSSAELWQQFKEQRTPAQREQLALAYLQLVRTQARQMAGRLPPSVKSEDLEGYGMVGLLEAIDRFDPDRSIPFEVFARLRVRGAMYDYLRTLDLLPRVARQNVHRVQAHANALSRSLGRRPTDDELAHATGMARRRVGKALSDAQAAMPLSLDEVADADRLPDLLVQGAAGDVLGRVEDQARDAELWRAIEALPVRHKLVVGLYFCEGLTLWAIGRVLGVTESRVSQMSAEALQMLRTHLVLRTWRDPEASSTPTDGSRESGIGS
jgi:RNA polymerase sigma factor FliA